MTANFDREWRLRVCTHVYTCMPVCLWGCMSIALRNTYTYTIHNCASENSLFWVTDSRWQQILTPNSLSVGWELEVSCGGACLLHCAETKYKTIHTAHRKTHFFRWPTLDDSKFDHFHVKVNKNVSKSEKTWKKTWKVNKPCESQQIWGTPPLDTWNPITSGSLPLVFAVQISSSLGYPRGKSEKVTKKWKNDEKTRQNDPKMTSFGGLLPSFQNKSTRKPP